MDAEISKILVVDDDADLRDLLNRYLSEQGFDVTGVEDGAAMDTFLAEHSADLIILDVMLPGEDGLSIAKRLRSGNVGINTLQRNHEAPFGGFKQSGVGRDGGSYGLLAYSELQSIVWST